MRPCRNFSGLVRRCFAPVPIPFDVSFVPTAGAHYTLALAIREGDRTLFATPAALPVTPNGEPLEILLDATR
jgi:hypothetical protein